MNTRLKAAFLTAVAALLGLAALAFGAVTKDVDGSGLVAGGRGWDFATTDSSGGIFGFSPVNDGVLASVRAGSDAFDGGLIVGVDGDGFADSDSKGKFSHRTNSFRVGPATTGATLRVSRTETARGPYLRSLVKLKNPTGSAVNSTVNWNSDLGSDGSESTQASATGDKNFSAADRWVISSQTGANAFGDDPTLTFVLSGKGASENVDVVNSGPGSGEVDVDYEGVRVPANSTRYLLFYTEMNASPGKAKDSVTKYNDRHLSRSLLRGIGNRVQNKVLNWDL